MSKHLGVSQTLEILEGLRSAGRDFTARADKLAEDFRLRTHRASHRRDTTLEELRQKLEAELAQEKEAFQIEIERTKANYERRKIRLGKAYRSSKERALAKVEEQTGNKKYALQRQMLQAERDRESALANASKELEAFRAELDEQQRSGDELEKTARKAFTGYRKFVRLLSATDQSARDERTRHPQQLLASLRGEEEKARTHLQTFRGFYVLRFFKYFWAWVVLLLATGGLLAGLNELGRLSLDYRLAGAGLVAAFVGLVLVRLAYMSKAGIVAKEIAHALTRARLLQTLSAEAAETHHQHELQRIEAEFRNTTIKADQDLKQALSDATELRSRSRTQTDEKTFRITDKHEKLHRLRLQRREREHAETLERLNSENQAAQQALLDSTASSDKKFKEEFQTQSQALETEWKGRTQPLFERLQSATAAAQQLFPPWASQSFEQWTPPPKFAGAAKFGVLEIDLPRLSEAVVGQASHLPPRADSSLSIPLCLTYPAEGSVIFETNNTGRDQAISSLNNTILRLLSVAPPGKLNFTIIDPVGLGQNFAGVMHLADYEEQLIHSRIWTQSTQIEQRLADLNEHMEKVIQMYLRNEYATIAEYNEQAGVIAEK